MKSNLVYVIVLLRLESEDVQGISCCKKLLTKVKLKNCPRVLGEAFLVLGNRNLKSRASDKVQILGGGDDER